MNSIKLQIYNPLAIVIAFFVALIILFGVLWVLIPPPPKAIEMATGFPTGLYYQFGERLKVELANDGVKLDLKTTGGTVDNLALLSDPKSGIEFGMVQGGVAEISKYPNLVSLAGMFYEPVWVWYRESAFKNEGGQLRVLNPVSYTHLTLPTTSRV